MPTFDYFFSSHAVVNEKGKVTLWKVTSPMQTGEATVVNLNFKYWLCVT